MGLPRSTALPYISSESSEAAPQVVEPRNQHGLPNSDAKPRKPEIHKRSCSSSARGQDVRAAALGTSWGSAGRRSATPSRRDANASMVGILHWPKRYRIARIFRVRSHACCMFIMVCGPGARSRALKFRLYTSFPIQAREARQRAYNLCPISYIPSPVLFIVLGGTVGLARLHSAIDFELELYKTETLTHSKRYYADHEIAVTHEQLPMSHVRIDANCMLDRHHFYDPHARCTFVCIHSCEPACISLRMYIRTCYNSIICMPSICLGRPRGDRSCRRGRVSESPVTASGPGRMEGRRGKDGVQASIWY